MNPPSGYIQRLVGGTSSQLPTTDTVGQLSAVTLVGSDLKQTDYNVLPPYNGYFITGAFRYYDTYNGRPRFLNTEDNSIQDFHVLYWDTGNSIWRIGRVADYESIDEPTSHALKSIVDQELPPVEAGDWTTDSGGAYGFFFTVDDSLWSDKVELVTRSSAEIKAEDQGALGVYYAVDSSGDVVEVLTYPQEYPSSLTDALEITQMNVWLASVATPTSTYPEGTQVTPSTGYVFPASFGSFQAPVAGSAAANTPDIYQFTHKAVRSDVMMVSSDAATEFTIFGEHLSAGTTQVATILQQDSLDTAIQLPTSMPTDGVMMLWAKNANGYGEPVLLNKPELWFNNLKEYSTLGDTLVVFGSNLKISDTHPYVYIEEENTWVEATKSNPYSASFALPALSAGTYTIWVHNGSGLDYGWSNSLSIEVDVANTYDAETVNVKTHGAKGDGSTDDYAAIASAIAACSSNGTIYFPEGVYPISARITGIGSNRQLLGDGANKSQIVKHPNWSRANADGLVHQALYGVKLQGLYFNADVNTHTGKILRCRSSNDVLVQDCNFNSPHTLQVPIDFENSSYARMDQCVTTTRTNAYFGGTTNTILTNSNFIAIKDCNALLNVTLAESVAIYGCVGRSFDASNPNKSAGWGKGRFISGQQVQGKYYIGENQTIDMYTRETTDGSSQPDQNSGENIMLEGSYMKHRDTVVSSTDTVITCTNTVEHTSSTIHWVYIMEGKGKGQTRRISDVTAANITVSEAFDVAPDNTSVIQTGYFFVKFAIYGNKLRGLPYASEVTTDKASAGVNLYGAFTETYVDSNDIADVRRGIFNWGRANHSPSPDAVFAEVNVYNIYQDNVIDNVREGINEPAYGTDGDTPNNDDAIFANVWRRNRITNAVRYGININQNANVNLNFQCYQDNNAEAEVAGFYDNGVTPSNPVNVNNTYTP